MLVTLSIGSGIYKATKFLKPNPSFPNFYIPPKIWNLVKLCHCQIKIIVESSFCAPPYQIIVLWLWLRPIIDVFDLVDTSYDSYSSTLLLNRSQSFWQEYQQSPATRAANWNKRSEILTFHIFLHFDEIDRNKVLLISYICHLTLHNLIVSI